MMPIKRLEWHIFEQEVRERKTEDVWIETEGEFFFFWSVEGKEIE